MKRFSYFASFCSLLILFLNDCFCKQEERVIRAGIFCKKEALEKIKTAANIDYAVFWGEGSVDLKYTFDEATGAVSVLAQDFIAFLEEVTRRFGNFPLSNFFVNGFLRTVFCGKLEGFCEDDYKNWVRIEKEKLEKYAVRFVKGFKDSGVFYIRSSTFILRDIGCRIFCNDKEVENRFFDEWKGGCVLREFCYKSTLLRMFKFNEECEMDERGENRFYEYKDSSDYEKASFWIKRNDGKEQYEISFDNINGIMRSLLWYIFSKKGDYGKKDKKDWDKEDNKYMFLTESGDWNDDYYVSINFPKEDMKLLLEHVGGGETPKENDKNENKKEKKKGEKGGNINNIVRGGDMTKNGGCCNEGCCCRCC